METGVPTQGHLIPKPRIAPVHTLSTEKPVTTRILSKSRERTGRAASGPAATPSSSSVLSPQWTAFVSVLTTFPAFLGLAAQVLSCF